ncbi:MAG: S49 family peptidase [Rubrobacteraceae bacterium]
MTTFLNFFVNLWRLLRNAYARFFRRPPDYVVLEIGGALPEFEARVGFLRRRFAPGPSGPSLEGLRGRLARVSADGRCRGVVLRIQNLDAGWASLEELRNEISLFRQRGGKVVAYLVEPDTRDYYLACATDEIIATPVSTLNVRGLRTKVNFLKDALRKVGVEAEVVAVSPYKSAGDTLTRNDFSEEAREQAERLLDGRFGELVDAISGGRGMSLEEVKEKIDLAPYGAPAAHAEGFFDSVCYEDELSDKLGVGGERARLAEWGSARRALAVPYRKTHRRKVGVVSLSGTIVRGKSRKLPVPLPLIGSEQAGSESVVGALRLAEKNRRVAAVLFHVDSRGGDALASDLIWREVQRITAKKPVVVLMGDAAASGGYYVAAPASHIIARRTTITGSIGVVITRPVTARLYEKLGVNPVAIERGARSGLLDVSRNPGPNEIGVLRDQLGFFYDGFKDRVSKGRNLALDSLENFAGGRVWSGAEALENGLVDETGGFRIALEKACELAGIEADPAEAPLKIPPPAMGRPMPGDPAGNAAETVQTLVQALFGLRKPAVWAALPYEISDDW